MVAPQTAPGTASAAAAKPAAVKKEPQAEKEPKAPKVAKPKKEGAVARARLPKYPDDHVITVIKEGAKARGAKDRFSRYHTGQTVKQYIDVMKADLDRTEGQTLADMRWDMEHKFIHVGPTVIDVPKPEPAPAKTEAPAAAPAPGASPTA